MSIGDVSGNILKKNDAFPSGLFKTIPINIKLAIIGNEIGKVNWFASWRLSTAEPIAAKNAPYKKNPPRKYIRKIKTVFFMSTAANNLCSFIRIYTKIH